MARTAIRAQALPRARSEPRPGWAILWLPLLVIVFDASPDLGAAMIRLALVLLLGMVAWGMGRGPAGPGAESGFAALLLIGWFAVCGITFRLHDPPDTIAARLTVAAGLLLGPALLLWAWRRRAGMAPVPDPAGGAARSGLAAALLRALALAGAALFVLQRLLDLPQTDLLVIGTGLALGAAFSVRGRRRPLGALG